jgi:Domain of unknown function (DUF5753)
MTRRQGVVVVSCTAISRATSAIGPDHGRQPSPESRNQPARPVLLGDHALPATAHAETLIRLAEQARQPGWWSAHSDDVPKWFTEYVSLESEATEVWEYQQGYFPGLLQTTAYTESITIAASTAAETAESAEGFARVRATRQQRLEGEAPLVLRVVVDESVLRRQVGGPDVMRE